MKICKLASLLFVLFALGCGETEIAEQTKVDEPRELVPGVDVPLNPQGDIRPKPKPKPALNLEAEAPPRRCEPR